MKRIPGLLTVVILLALPVFAGGPELEKAKEPKDVKLTGYFTDEWCGESNANAEGAGCAKACAKKGSAMALFSEGRLYKVDDADKQKAIDNVGVEVVVQGALQPDGTLKIASVKKTPCKKG